MSILPQVTWLAYLVAGKPEFLRKMLPLHLVALEYARDMLGVKEVGENWGPEVKMFLEAAGVGVPAPWCAGFVNWCAQKAGMLLGLHSALEDVPLQAYVQSYYKLGNAQGWIIPPEQARPGDLFLLYFPRLKRYAHIGWVDKGGVDLDLLKFHTVEGNTNEEGQREGLYVMTRTRRLTNCVIFMRWA